LLLLTSQTKMTPMTSTTDLKDVSPDELEAFVQVVVLVAYADGDLSETEEKVLVEAVQKMAGGRVDDEHLKDLMEELPPMSRGSNNWRSERIAELKKNLPHPNLRNEAFRLAVQVARSDDKIGLREGRMLVNIITELEIENSFAQEVLAYKEK
jgi:tellurite resistance protein